MRIVPQLACLSYSPLPALAAPRIAGLLPAPAIGGLLTAGSLPQPRSHIQRQLDIWTAADAEVAAFVEGARSRLLAFQVTLRAEVRCA